MQANEHLDMAAMLPDAESRNGSCLAIERGAAKLFHQQSERESPEFASYRESCRHTCIGISTIASPSTVM